MDLIPLLETGLQVSTSLCVSLENLTIYTCLLLCIFPKLSYLFHNQILFHYRVLENKYVWYEAYLYENKLIIVSLYGIIEKFKLQILHKVFLKKFCRTLFY